MASPSTLVAGVLVFAYAVRPLVLIIDGDADTLATGLDRTSLEAPFLMVSLFVASLAVGFWLHSLRAPRSRQFEVVDTRAVAPVAWSILAALVSMGALFGTVRLSGIGLWSAFANPVFFRAEANEGGLFYLSGLAIATSWIPFWFALVFCGNKTLRNRVLVVTFICGLIVTYPFGQRSYVLAPIIGLVAWKEHRKGALPLRWLIVGVLGLSVTMGAYSTYRAAAGAGIGFDADSYSVNGSVRNFSARFDAFDFFSQTQQGWESRPYLMGRTATDLLAQPVPRSLMPDKPSQTSAYLIGLQQPSVGRTFTPEYGLISELFINGGPALIVLGGALAGWAVGVFDRIASIRPGDKRRAFLILPFLTFPALWVLGGFNSFTTVSFILFMSVQVLFATGALRGYR